ncbi:MAG: malto-oligosyltrehalose synthase [Cyclobacteriaceae bacterium]
MNVPSSTYRIQLHKGFTFKNLQRIVDYLYTLGISTIYASPIMEATPGSMHGYDVTDPHTINPELGTADDLKSLSRDLSKKDMQWLQDIVPNHMAFNTMNYRLMDVLERGPESPYYRYFDIDWNHSLPELKGKVMVPFLGNELIACIEKGEIKLAFSEKGFSINYLETSYPLSLSAYPLLKSLIEEAEGETPLLSILSKMTAASRGVKFETWNEIKKEFLVAVNQVPAQVELIGKVVESLNEDHGQLSDLIARQYYKLSFWKETDTRINYRRFFTVNELICLRMEDEKVFDEYHAYLFKLCKEKLIHGFRIDHIDGLQDPAMYTQNLRKLIGDGCYIIAEKILEAKEDMPAQWSLQGTSGYEFLSFLNQLLTYRKGAKQLLSFYQELLPDMPSYRKLILDSKKLILENYIGGEWDNLTNLLQLLELSGEYDGKRMKQALGLFMLSLPVYRIYPDSLPLKGKSLLIIHEAFDKALSTGPDYTEELNHLRNLFTGSPTNEKEHERVLLFLKRLMQFTGPLTAKGVEDTTFYIYNPLISHDEVGDSPLSLGMTVERFHQKMQMRQTNTPLSLNATATHDTKRGEDARVRINVLSRIPELWIEHVTHWLKINKPFRKSINGKTAPEINDEYFIYQSMLGGFPEDFQVTEEWIERVQAYLNKALREAKVNTNWSEPDEQYEKACEQFIEQILNEDHKFLSTFIPFLKTVLEHAMVYTLSQTLIKLTAPGIPDIYQGCELWDLSFVDPDNRRPVDYDKRMQFLFQLVVKEEKGKDALFEFLREHREAGIEKLYISWKTLNFRKSHPLLFTEGDYVPLAITGKKINAAAYARNRKDEWALVAFPFGLVKHEMDLNAAGPDEQYVVLPENAPHQWMNFFTGEELEIPNQISLNEIFKDFPVALLVSVNSSKI